MRPRNAGDDPTLRIIHAVILGGTLTFLAVVFFLYRGERDVPAGAVLRWGWLLAAVVAVFAAGYLRGRLGPGSAPGEVRTAGILIWAIAEGAALIGMVSTIVTGDVSPAIGATLIAAFLMLHHRPSQLT